MVEFTLITLYSCFLIKALYSLTEPPLFRIKLNSKSLIIVFLNNFFFHFNHQYYYSIVTYQTSHTLRCEERVSKGKGK